MPSGLAVPTIGHVVEARRVRLDGVCGNAHTRCRCSPAHRFAGAGISPGAGTGGCYGPFLLHHSWGPTSHACRHPEGAAPFVTATSLTPHTERVRRWHLLGPPLGGRNHGNSVWLLKTLILWRARSSAPDTLAPAQHSAHRGVARPSGAQSPHPSRRSCQHRHISSIHHQPENVNQQRERSCGWQWSQRRKEGRAGPGRRERGRAVQRSRTVGVDQAPRDPRCTIVREVVRPDVAFVERPHPPCTGGARGRERDK